MKILSFRKSIRALVLIFILGLCYSQTTIAQSYTYEAESFEEPVWGTASSSSNEIEAQTGTWTVAKNNIQSTAVTAQDGSFSLVFATKTNALITPLLGNGAGTLTYYMNRSGGGRVIMVATSPDKVTWSNAVDSISVTSGWSQRRVEINDHEVRYIRFYSNSNGGVHIDNVSITSAGASDVTVITSAASQITQNSAHVGGIITVDGSSSILSRGVCYNTTGLPDISSEKVEIEGTTGSFSTTLNNLTSATKYYLKAYAVTAQGVSYGEEISFSTRSGDIPLAYWMQDFNDQSQFPSSKPESPEEIDVQGQGTWIYMGAYKNTNPAYIPDGSASSLRMLKSGSYVITPLLEDGITEVSFEEGRSGRSLTIYVSTNGGTQWTLLETITTLKKEINIISVNRADVNRIKIANESGGDADIDNLSITVFPSGTVPTVTTVVAGNIGKNTASSGGEVTSDGSKTVVERGICWSLESVPLLDDNRTIDNGGSGAFTTELTGLPAGKLIYYRAYARSRAGTGYGNTYSFTTEEATIPVVSTIVATSVTGETAVGGGTISDTGGAAMEAQGVCWSTAAEPTIEDSKTIDTSDSDSFVSKLTDLNPNTQYYYRAYATNEAGTGYGNILTFTTGSVSIPAVSTSAISSVLSYKVVGGGIITDNGNAPVVAGLCWSESKNPTVNDKKTIVDDAEGSFESIIGNLKGGTKYYYRAYATNSVGTVYGEEMSFTTELTKVIYVSPGGDDNTADGSKEKPFYLLQNAVNLVSAGDTIYMQGGTYIYSDRINIGTVGAADGGTINLFAAKGQRALLDFSSMPLDPNNQGIRMTGSYWHVYGLDIKGAGDNGLLIERNKPTGGTPEDIKNKTEEGHHNTIEFCSFYENKDTGLQMKNMAEYNRVINCDSYFNRDAEDGNADGFAPKLSVGTGNYFYGCRAWNNSDDGWDGILYDAKEGFEDDMTTIYENCWAFNNGFLKDGSVGRGNGNGFKFGGSSNMDRRHNAILIRCLAFDNLMKGFDQNHNTGSMTLINCTGHSNKYLANKNHFTYKIDEDILSPGKELTLINCVAVWDGITDPSKSAYTPLRLMEGVRSTCDFMTSASDYISVDTTGVTGPRQADGSLPYLDFMRIKPGSVKLIDSGTIVEGLEYNGAAPDLGCFETGSITGIEDIEILEQGPELLIYPQPVTEQFTVKVFSGSDEGKYSLKIFDLRGNTVLMKRFSGDSANVERGNIASGMYIIHVMDEVYRSSFSSKLIFK